jgi:hypothetical protein
MGRDIRNPRGDQDGVRVFESGGDRRVARAWFVVAVVAVVVLSATALVFLRRESGTRAAPEVSMRAVEKQRGAAQPVHPVARPTLQKRAAAHLDQAAKPARPVPISNPAGDRTQDPIGNSAAVEEEHQQVENLARDWIEGLKASGETAGIAAFPPAGTNPIKTGIVVPENFELPEGYVRYYQTTDDGRRLKPILMFSPDYQLVDGNGQPIPLPQDGIVPPDMAPPGLPVRMLEIPKAALQ